MGKLLIKLRNQALMNGTSYLCMTQMTHLISPPLQPQAAAAAAALALQFTVKGQVLQMGQRGLWPQIQRPFWTQCRGVGPCCHGIEASRDGVLKEPPQGNKSL